jgi:hypothetical protein
VAHSHNPRYSESSGRRLCPFNSQALPPATESKRAEVFISLQTDKIWYRYNGISLSLKENKVVINVVTWTNLEMLSQKS